MPTSTPSDLELLIASAQSKAARTAAKRGIPEVFHDVVLALTTARIDYVIAGAMARSLYAPARYTKDIDIVALDESRHAIKKALTAAGLQLRQDLDYQLMFIDPQTRVEVDILLGEIDPERSAVEDPRSAKLFNTPALVIKPEYLLWMYCLSDQHKHFVDALEIVKEGKADLALLRRYLSYAHDDVATEQLNKIVEQAGKERHSSYSARQAQRRQS